MQCWLPDARSCSARLRSCVLVLPAGRTSAACNRTSVPARDCHLADRGIRRHAADRRLHVPAVGIVGVARQAAAGFHRLCAPRQDRYAVPAFLTMPDCAITGGANGCLRKLFVGRLQLLKTDDVRRGLFQPGKQAGQPAVDAVDVESRDPHRRPFSSTFEGRYDNRLATGGFHKARYRIFD
jgi:hypothetical protein